MVHRQRKCCCVRGCVHVEAADGVQSKSCEPVLGSVLRVDQPFVTMRLSLSALTAEQYQQHQEQLALMHKQQLDQAQQQQQANSTANRTQVGNQLQTDVTTRC